MMSTVIGGAMLPHAPQFFTMPDTEDKALVAHVREVAAGFECGIKLKNYNDIKEGDLLEFFEVKEIARTL